MKSTEVNKNSGKDTVDVPKNTSVNKEVPIKEATKEALTDVSKVTYTYKGKDVQKIRQDEDIVMTEVRNNIINFAITGVVLMLIGVLGICLFLKGRNIAVKVVFSFSIILGIVVFVTGIFVAFKQRNKMRKYIENFSFAVNNSVNSAVTGFSDPMVVVKLNGCIQWYNKRFFDFCGKKAVYGMKLQELLPNIRISVFTEDAPSIKEYSYNGKDYILHSDISLYSSEDRNTALISITFSDISELTKLQKQVEDKKTVFCYAVIDNYDEVLKETPNSNHGILIGDIERCIGNWVEKGEGIYKHFERDKFIILFEEANFERITAERFDILNEIKEIDQQNKIPVTLSIGVSNAGDSLKENEIIANEALDMALGRGGDQAVLKTVSGYKFYGARSLGVEKTTKVKARVVAQNLCSLMDSASRIVIMGHQNADYDSFGAAVGLCRMAFDRGKRAYIALDKNKCNVEEILPDILNHEEYKDCIIGRERAVALTDKYTLLITVDTHRKSMTEYPELFDKGAKAVIIDHHRRCEDFIENAALVYHEPYASSASEMVTEILQYTDSTYDISVYEAEALYCGIHMDTKAFTFKTGARTFEAAAYLRKKGVDPVGVRKLFRNDISMYIQKSKVISNAKIYRDNIAIAICDEITANVSIVVAQAADDLLNINGVEASFVLAQAGQKTIISGRSLGAINVQVILEKLGGGGHSTIAGAQLENIGLSLAELKLHNAIDEVLFE